MNCLSPHRKDSYARFYMFSLAQQADVTITLESETDTYLLLMLRGTGEILAEHDDIDEYNGNFNSRIERTLDAGDYLIEATTYYAKATGDFTLTVEGVGLLDDRAALVALYNATDGDDWTNKANWLSNAPLSEWHGVWTNNQGRVTRIDLEGNNLSGSVPSELQSLAYLSWVNISINSLTGQLPQSMTGLARLDYFYFDQNAGLCAPSDAAFQAWLQSLEHYRGDTCGGTPLQPSPIPTGCVLQAFSGASVDDTWTSDCISRNRTENGDHYAKFFSFSVSRSSIIDLTLVSSVDTYLLLLDEMGAIIDEDDDNDDRVFNLPVMNSGIRIALQPGDYIAEATTYAGAMTGDFTLNIDSPEMAALRALYDDTDGANWTNSDNWFTNAPLSDWHGIKTDDEGRITEIYLIGNNLNGEIPAELGRLAQLEGLYLARNELSGSIPSELSNLSSLKTLMLFDNDLTGEIPYQFGNLESLEEMHLGRNKLSGRIPGQLGNLANLRRLHLTVNELSGNIPASLGNLSELRQLSIAANNLNGYIPAGIADLSELTHIYLWGNDLTAGVFIHDLNELENLRFLDIGGNRIDGSQALAQLEKLDGLTGLGLHASDLTNAHLTEYMADLQELENLEFLNLSGNGLSDPQTLVGLSDITSLQRLAINGNNFSGELPRAMTQFTLMRLFYFHDNDGLCAPADAEFQGWLADIGDVRGDACASGNSTQATASISSANSASETPAQESTSAIEEHSLTRQ